MDAKEEARMWSAAMAAVIRAEQAARDLSDAEMAAGTGIAPSTYWSLSKGKTKVSVAQLRAIARALRMSPARLFDLADARMAEMPANESLAKTRAWIEHERPLTPLHPPISDEDDESGVASR